MFCRGGVLSRYKKSAGDPESEFVCAVCLLPTVFYYFCLRVQLELSLSISLSHSQHPKLLRLPSKSIILQFIKPSSDSQKIQSDYNQTNTYIYPSIHTPPNPPNLKTWSPPQTPAPPSTQP
ncbi:hypothetical protein QC760_002274 [Botrytis cinerea]